MKKLPASFTMHFFIILILLPGCTNGAIAKKPPVALNGVLDCSGWNFSRDGIFDLQGAWKFSWLENDENAAQPEFDDSAWTYFAVPGYWNSSIGTPYGFGWFRLKVINLSEQDLGLYLRNTSRSYELFINGVKLMDNGKPGVTRETTVHQRLPRLQELPAGYSMVLAWKIANFSDPYGGPAYPLKIGKVAVLQDFFWKDIIVQIILISIMGIMFLYHFFLWFARREDTSSLLFAGFCLVLIIRTLVINNYLSLLAPGADIFELCVKLELLTLPFGWFFLQNFFMKLFPVEFSKRLYSAFFVANVIFSLLALLLPSWISLYTLFGEQLVLVLASVWVVISIITAIGNRREGAWPIFTGFIIIFLTIINDILFSLFPTSTTSLIQFGMVVFIFCQSASLSYRFAQTFKTVEKLSLHLQEEVDKQTGQITEQNRELKKLNQELDEAHRQKTNFFISIAHETKTPLTLINNYLQQYIRKHGLSKEMIVIKRNIDTLLKDMVDFLDLEKIEKGKLLYHHDQIVNLTAAIEAKAVSFGELARQRHISLAVRLQREVYMKIDPAALERIINNVLDNAVKFNKESGEIRLTLETRRKKAVLTVQDTGIGMSENQVANIFTPFYQALQTQKNVQGIGIGLSIIKKIVDGLGGQILVESTLGQGTKFTFVFKQYVPVKGEAVERQAVFTPVPAGLPVPVIREEEYRKDRHTLLVVEDNPEMLAYLVNNLRESYNVCFAVNGKEALEKLKDAPKPVLVVSDIMMNEIDGYELYDRLARRRDFAGVPFIFLTARTALDEKLQGLARGALDYITKPFEIRELLAKIGNAIKNYQLLKQMVTVTTKKRILKKVKQKIQEGVTRGFEENCRKYGITEKEKEIIRRILNGKIHKEICYELNIAHNTVKNHLKRIYRKCQVKTKVELLNCLKKSVPVDIQGNS
jgi:two-component system sensor histidine kinase ChiS